MATDGKRPGFDKTTLSEAFTKQRPRKFRSALQRRKRNTPGALLEGDFYLNVAARRGRVYRSRYAVKVLPHHSPRGIAKHYDSDFSALQILLVADIFIRSQHQLEPLRLSLRQKLAVRNSVPAALYRFRYLVNSKRRRYTARRAVVKQNAHQ